MKGRGGLGRSTGNLLRDPIPRSQCPRPSSRLPPDHRRNRPRLSLDEKNFLALPSLSPSFHPPLTLFSFPMLPKRKPLFANYLALLARFVRAAVFRLLARSSRRTSSSSSSSLTIKLGNTGGRLRKTNTDGS